MWVKQCQKHPVGNMEWFIPPINMVIWGMVYSYFTHMKLATPVHDPALARAQPSLASHDARTVEPQRNVRFVAAVFTDDWLVVGPPLWKIWKSIGMIIPNIWENKKWQPNHQRDEYMEVSINGGSWIDGWFLWTGKPHLEMDDDWGYLDFRTPPYDCNLSSRQKRYWNLHLRWIDQNHIK